MRAVILLNRKKIVEIPVIKLPMFAKTVFCPQTREVMEGVFYPTLLDLQTHFPKSEGYSIQTEGEY